MPEYVITLLSAYVVTADDEHSAGEAAYDLVTGAHIQLKPDQSGPLGRVLGSARERGAELLFTDGRKLRAFNAELAVPVEEVVERSEVEMMQDATNLINGMLGGPGVSEYEVWTVKQTSGVWWVRDQDNLPVVSDETRTSAIELAEAIGKDAGRVFKIIQEKS
jgi:hypothetical protein